MHYSNMEGIETTSAYRRDTYNLTRFELVAPNVRNDGTPSHYAEGVRKALSENGFTGWTEFQTVGHWQGRLEPGTTFVIFAEPEQAQFRSSILTIDLLAEIGRAVMPDQDAVQVVAGETVTLKEG